MKLINQSAQYLPQQAGIDGIYKQIELAGRTSYLSWDKMTDDSAKKFVDMLVKSKHTSVLEHGTVYLYANDFNNSVANSDWLMFDSNPYSKVKFSKRGTFITTNLRVIYECGAWGCLDYLCEPTEFHEKRLSVKVVTSRSISHELVRHRSMSFIQESQRYVGYDKDKFGGEVTYIIPSFLNLSEGYYGTDPIGIETFISGPDYKHNALDWCSDKETPFVINLLDSELYYKTLIQKLGCKPQEAREVLPNATKTTLVITAFESDWREWFAQRLFGKTGEPHPQMKQLAELIKQEFEKAGVWEGIMKYPSKYDD